MTTVIGQSRPTPALRALEGAPDVLSYDRILLAFSGGKDSLAALLHLLELGVDPARIELHHHDVDGEGESFMDWPVTPDYCRAVAAAFSLPLYFSGKAGGFLREMDRDGTPTAPTYYDLPGGGRGYSGGKGPAGKRLRFPQVSADLSVRWCSAYLKIDVMAAAICGQDRFLSGRTLVVTGERAEESPSRARYATFERHRTDTRDGSRRVRHVDHWRPVHAWEEAAVWEIIGRWRVAPHPAYVLGWGRLSCLSCIFGSPDQWATIAAVFPEHFERIARKEEATGATIQRKATVRQLAAKGRAYLAALERPDVLALAMSRTWSGPVILPVWTLPAGAFGENAGPL
jgi:3'-phosphoadenosine 5'-phosphosulfate sulfotransferase (PAPS reductase)/FAD synthetase